MIKEITQFIQTLDPDFKTLGLKPKDGLHVLLRIQKEDRRVFMDERSLAGWVYTKTKNPKPEAVQLLKRFASLTQLSWCVNTNKCFDLPVKAIHSCSPYCLALKKENLVNGEKYLINHKDKKTQVYDRVSAYFSKSFDLLEDENERQRLQVFKQALNGEQAFHQWLEKIPEYADVKDAEYVIFYLDEPEENYKKANSRYLADKLFNTNEHNKTINDLVFGTSDFLNGFPTKKPFLTHQSASFDIAGRISSGEAKALFEFKDLIGRNILPKPLPVFIYNDELKNASIALFKKGAEDEKPLSYKTIIESLYERHKNELGNYYLLFYQQGEIKDFDFVSKFEYELKDDEGKPWIIDDLFNSKYTRTISNVFELQYQVLLPVFNNALITKTKTGDFQHKYFDDIDAKYCKSENTYLMIVTYRKAFYDYIYKGKRQSVSQEMFNSILLTLVLDDIRLDEIKNNNHTQNLNIKQKLNIWFSLAEKFNLKNLNPNITMASKLQAHREFVDKLAIGQVSIQNDEQYAFVVGQIIFYLLHKSKSIDYSHKRLEPFMQQINSVQLNKALVRLFDTYKHDEYFSKRFGKSFSEVMDYTSESNLRESLPSMLAGYFSDNQLFGSKEAEKEEPIETIEE